MDCGCCGCSGRGLLCADGAECGEQLIIDGPGIVEKRTNDALNAFNVLRWEYGFGDADWFQLLVGAICDWDVRMWCMLGFGRLWVCIFKEVGFDVAVHGQATRAFGVVPREVNASKFGAVPVSGDSVVAL